MYTYEEVLKSALDYFKGDELAANVWISKYCLKDHEGNYLELNPDEMHRRLAKEFARAEKKYDNSLTEEEIYQHFKEFKYIVPGGSVMSGLGNEGNVSSLSNCFVIQGPGDSYSDIMRAREEQVQLMKRRKLTSCVA